MYSKIKSELYATDCQCFEIKFYTADQLPSVFGLSNVQKMTIKTYKNVSDSSPDFTAVNSTLPACAIIPNQQNFTRHDEPDSTSQPSSRAAKSSPFALLSRAIKHSDVYLKVLFLQNRKYFEYFFCFHLTLGISPKDLERFKADINAFICTTLACSLAISTNLNFDLTFVTPNFIGSCVIRCTF